MLASSSVTVVAVCSYWYVCLLLVATRAERVGLSAALQPPRRWEAVAHGTSQIVLHSLLRCHLVIVAPRWSPASAQLLREVSEASVAAVVVAMAAGPSGGEECEGRHHLWERVWASGMKATCRALVLDNTAGDNAAAAAMVAGAGVWLQPDTRVVVMGGRDDVHKLLTTQGLRNTRHALYVTAPAPAPARQTHVESGSSAEVYARCLYCNAGQAKVYLLARVKPTGAPRDLEYFSDKRESLEGRTLDIVAKTYFPTFNYRRLTDQPGTRVTPTDSLNTRMIAVLAAALNFTYTVREPEDGQWGLLGVGGNWTGLVGLLQYEKADLSLDITLMQERAQVVDFTIVYSEELVVIVSAKPKPLPEYLSLVRPLEGEVWVGVIVGVMVWSVTLWLLERLRRRHLGVGGRQLSLASSMFFGLGLLLEDNPKHPPRALTSRILMCAWLVLVLIITTGYKSSLISHLVVAGKSDIINTMQDLAEADGWQWGTRRMTGVLKDFLSSSTDPAIVTVYKHMQTVDIEEGMKRVVEGGFSYIYNYYYLKTLVPTRYTDHRGYTPVHIGSARYPLFAGNAWAFRRGAPFQRGINKAIQHLVTAGLVDFWLDDVINDHVSNERRAAQGQTGTEGPRHTSLAAEDGQVVLGLSHLQGTFYTLLLGDAAAALALLAEHLLRPTTL